MHAVDAPGLLQAWEDASGRAMPARALRLVAAAIADPIAPAALARWSVRRRDAALCELRLHLFGRVAEGLVPCPACAEPLELQVDVLQVRPKPSADDEDARVLRIGDLTVTWRLPNSEDLVAIAEEPDESRARARLLARCVSSATRGPEHLDVSALDADVTERVAAALAREHADLAPLLVLDCPACGHMAEVPFAIDAFLWREVDAWARRTLGEVHALARAYGWTEPEILALSATRRRLYLELASHA